MAERASKPGIESDFRTTLHTKELLRPEAPHTSTINEEIARALNNPSLPIDDFEKTPTGFDALKFSSDIEAERLKSLEDTQYQFNEKRGFKPTPSQEATSGAKLPGYERREKKPVPATAIELSRQCITELTGILDARSTNRMDAETAEVYKNRIDQERQKLASLLIQEQYPTKPLVAPKRGLTAESFAAKLMTGTPTIREHKPFIRKAMTPEEQQAWTKKQQEKLKVGGYQEEVKFEQFVQGRNKKLAESIGKKDAAWFNDDTRETYRSRGKSEKKPAPAGFFSRLKNLFRG